MGNLPEQIDYLRLPNAAYFLILALAAPIFFFFASRGEAVRGFVAALSTCAVLGVGTILRPHANQRMYWVTLTAMAVAHALLSQSSRGLVSSTDQDWCLRLSLSSTCTLGRGWFFR